MADFSDRADTLAGIVTLSFLAFLFTGIMVLVDVFGQPPTWATPLVQWMMIAGCAASLLLVIGGLLAAYDMRIGLPVLVLALLVIAAALIVWYAYPSAQGWIAFRPPREPLPPPEPEPFGRVEGLIEEGRSVIKLPPGWALLICLLMGGALLVGAFRLWIAAAMQLGNGRRGERLLELIMQIATVGAHLWAGDKFQPADLVISENSSRYYLLFPIVLAATITALVGSLIDGPGITWGPLAAALALLVGGWFGAGRLGLFVLRRYFPLELAEYEAEQGLDLAKADLLVRTLHLIEQCTISAMTQGGAAAARWARDLSLTNSRLIPMEVLEPDLITLVMAIQQMMAEGSTAICVLPMREPFESTWARIKEALSSLRLEPVKVPDEHE